MSDSITADLITNRAGTQKTIQPKTSAEAVKVGNSTLDVLLTALDAELDTKATINDTSASTTTTYSSDKIEELIEQGGGGQSPVYIPNYPYNTTIDITENLVAKDSMEFLSLPSFQDAPIIDSADDLLPGVWKCLCDPRAIIGWNITYINSEDNEVTENVSDFSSSFEGVDGWSLWFTPNDNSNEIVLATFWRDETLYIYPRYQYVGTGDIVAVESLEIILGDNTHSQHNAIIAPEQRSVLSQNLWFYIDPINGDNTNSGLTWDAAWADATPFLNMQFRQKNTDVTLMILNDQDFPQTEGFCCKTVTIRGAGNYDEGTLVKVGMNEIYASNSNSLCELTFQNIWLTDITVGDFERINFINCRLDTTPSNGILFFCRIKRMQFSVVDFYTNNSYVELSNVSECQFDVSGISMWFWDINEYDECPEALFQVQHGDGQTSPTTFFGLGEGLRIDDAIQDYYNEYPDTMVQLAKVDDPIAVTGQWEPLQLGIPLVPDDDFNMVIVLSDLITRGKYIEIQPEGAELEIRDISCMPVNLQCSAWDRPANFILTRPDIQAIHGFLTYTGTTDQTNFINFTGSTNTIAVKGDSVETIHPGDIVEFLIRSVAGVSYVTFSVWTIN